MIGLDAIQRPDAPRDDWYMLVVTEDGARRIPVKHDESGIYPTELIHVPTGEDGLPVSRAVIDVWVFHETYYPEPQTGA